MLRVFECFAGYGSQSMSLKDLGIEHKVVGISEIDPDAIIGYGAIRYKLDDIEINKDISIDDMRKELISKNIGKDFKTGKSQITRMKKDKLERLYKFNKMSNNFGDISIIDPTLIPDFDYMTYSFPCTDISIAGAQKGIIKNNTRSGLLYECEKIIEIKKPKYLLMENVKALLSKKFLSQFNEWCEYLENLGYTNYYKVLNAKDFGIPQNRERVFVVSILGEHSPYVMPNGFPLEKRLKDFLEENIEEKYYLSDEIQKRFKQTKADDGNNNIIGTTAPDFRTIGYKDLVYGKNAKTMGTLLATDYTQPKQIIDKIITVKDKNELNYHKNRMLSDAFCNKMEKHEKVVQTLDEIKVNRIGGIFETKKSKHQFGSIYSNNGLPPTLSTTQGGYAMPLTEESNYKIRKLTPKECLRLMGVSDDNIEKMKSIGLSNSSLYKLAGNSIVKQCLDSIHKELFKDIM